MENTDFELINRTISGDQDAFATLVRRYQERVHALAWRKTGDFHAAEDITQDTFLRAYRKLGALKNPNLFAGWLYVIANRLCNTWFKKREPDMQSLETVPIVELEEHLYSEYTTKQREERASEKRINLVKRLLQKLPESERIVMTLHYLAGSSCQEISEFLGVSLNTVKSRLHRARKRLQKEDHMVRETLGSFQPSTNLTENIIRTLKETGTQIDPTAPSGNKPLVPWAIAASTLILVTLMLGLGTQHLARFQQPYSLDATSEMIVDIVDAAVISNLPSDPDVRNQIGNADAPNKSDGTNQNPDAKLSSSASGRVVDEAGNPVSGIKIAIVPVKDGNGAWFPIQTDEDGEPIDVSQYQSETDSEGRFSITNTVGGPALLTLFPYHRFGIRILKVQIAGMFLYLNERKSKPGIVFTTSSDKPIENIQVILKQPQIRGKAQRIDGTPIANAQIRFTVGTVNTHGGSFYGEGAADTDAEGHFMYYLDEKIWENTAHIYMMSVTYQKQTVEVKPFVLKSAGQPHDVVFTFGGPHQPSSLRQNKGFTRTSFSTNPDAQDVWVINPENGHAYKKIGCRNPNDAIAQASKEDAHLVTINNAAEQNWLSKVFRGSVSFIGLNDIAAEGQWQWHNGEPVEYTNWAKGEPQDNNSKHENYVIFNHGKWKDIGPRSLQWDSVQTALIEKKDLPVKK
jgi:RNA polymerase sigma factor (sigma-70 family)